MRVHLVNPSDNSFGTAVITPRWLFVLAAATPAVAGDPVLVEQGRHMAATFHPELTPDSSIHEMFLDKIERNA